jgi:hypothetical protein
MSGPNITGLISATPTVLAVFSWADGADGWTANNATGGSDGATANQRISTGNNVA